MRPGDTLRVRVRVGEKRLASGGERGVVRLALEALNQCGEVVQEGELTTLVRTRPEPSGRAGSGEESPG